jgi:hypothetical protein
MPLPPMPTPVVFNDPPKDPVDSTKDRKPVTDKKPEKKAESPPSSSPAAEEPEKKKLWPYILFGVGGLLVLGAGIFVVVHTRGSGKPDDDDDEDDDEEEDERPRAKKKKPMKKGPRR